MSSYTYITRQHQLDLMISQLKGASRVAVDTESSGYYTYFPELCLIQLSSEDYHFIVDTLAGLKLDALGDLFADPKVIKIFHSAASDIQEMRREYNWNFNSIFDTFLASRMLGQDSCSLASLVQNYLGVSMQKGEQKSNWKKRPLTRSQLDYAHLDTAYLERLMDRMEAELKRASLLEEYQEETRWIIKEQDFIQEKQFQPEGWVHLPGALSLDPVQRGHLKELYLLRDVRARKLNVAPFRLATNKSLLEMAQKVPESREELEQLKALNPRYLQKEADRFLKVFEQSIPIEDDDLPREEELDSRTLNLLRMLKRWRVKTAQKRKMDASVILNNRVLTRIALERPTTVEELERLDLMTHWKLVHYGPELIRVLQRKEDSIKETDPADESVFPGLLSSPPSQEIRSTDP